jgi:hypothetical protein
VNRGHLSWMLLIAAGFVQGLGSAFADHNALKVLYETEVQKTKVKLAHYEAIKNTVEIQYKELIAQEDLARSHPSKRKSLKETVKRLEKEFNTSLAKYYKSSAALKAQQKKEAEMGARVESAKIESATAIRYGLQK